MNIQGKPTPVTSSEPTTASFVALAGVPHVKPGDDLAGIILMALAASQQQLHDGDVLVIAQKIVSKAQGRLVELATVMPSREAEILALEVNKDPRLVELILRESTEVVAHRRDVLIVTHRLGFVTANAGIDQSNVEHVTGETALLLPENPDRTCAQLRADLRVMTGADVAIVINDSHGRAFRNGTVGVAIGASGIAGLVDLRGEPDLYGRRLQRTEVALADEIAAAASLLMGQASEGKPIVLARGIACSGGKGSAADLIRPKQLDLFRAVSADTVLRTRRSIRRYTEEPVQQELLDHLLAAAICAPSAHNRQPWRFAVLPTMKLRKQLANAMAARLRADRTQDGDDPAAIEADAARSIARISEAPLAIVVCLTMSDMDAYPDARRRAAEREMAVQGTAMAVQNLLLAATAAGLGNSIACAPLFCPETVRETLALPADWEPQSLVTLGYPADKGKPFSRRPISDVVRILDGSS